MNLQEKGRQDKIMNSIKWIEHKQIKFQKDHESLIKSNSLFSIPKTNKRRNNRRAALNFGNRLFLMLFLDKENNLQNLL